MLDPQNAFLAEIVAAVGHAPELIQPGRMHRFSTNGRRSDAAGWCKLFDDMRGGVYGCHRLGISKVWTAVDGAQMTRAQRADLARHVAKVQAERAAEQRARWEANARNIAALWAECGPLVPGDPVTAYLTRRGFGGVWPLPGCLRYHPGLDYWHEGEMLGRFRAMVASVVAPDGRIVALHRTYLSADGRKATVPAVRKLTGSSGPLAGACILLHKPRAGVIGIAEGIETALAAWCASAVPTVAAYCAGNLAAWGWPAGVKRLVIFADADNAGRKAAYTLRARALGAGLRAEVLTPTTECTDWCDVWAERGADLIEAGGTA